MRGRKNPPLETVCANPGCGKALALTGDARRNAIRAGRLRGTGPVGYCPGGECGKAGNLAPERRAKISAAKKGRKVAFRRSRGPCSAETKARISASEMMPPVEAPCAHCGMLVSVQGRKRYQLKRRVYCAEHGGYVAVAAANTGQKRSAETRAKQSAATKEQMTDPAARANQSAAVKARWAAGDMPAPHRWGQVPTESEKMLHALLGPGWVLGYTVGTPGGDGCYRLDICHPGEGVVIEVDGPEHGRSRAYDEERTRFLIEERGWRIVSRIKKSEVLARPEAWARFYRGSVEVETAA